MQRLYILQYFHRYSPVYNIHISALSTILQRYTFYTVRWGRSDTVVWKWPRHGRNRASTILADFPFIPYLSECGSTTTFLNDFFRWLALAYLWNAHRYHHFGKFGYRPCISLPPRPNPPKVEIEPGHSRVMPALRQFRVKSLCQCFQCNNLLHIFSCSHDAVQNSF